MQLDDMMLETESDLDYYWVQNLGLSTVLHGGDAMLMNWWFGHLVQMSLSVVKSLDDPADKDKVIF
jgi:hypothetical protein